MTSALTVCDSCGSCGINLALENPGRLWSSKAKHKHRSITATDGQQWGCARHIHTSIIAIHHRRHSDPNTGHSRTCRRGETRFTQHIGKTAHSFAERDVSFAYAVKIINCHGNARRLGAIWHGPCKRRLGRGDQTNSTRNHNHRGTLPLPATLFNDVLQHTLQYT